MLNKLFNMGKTKITARVVFREDTAAIGEHGSIFADHKQKNLVNESIPFAFVGVSEIPALDPDVLQHVFNEARAAGYLPRSVRSYATVMTVKPAPILTFNTPRPDPELFRAQARAASKDMSKQHAAAKQATARKAAADPENGHKVIGTSHHTPRPVAKDANENITRH